MLWLDNFPPQPKATWPWELLFGGVSTHSQKHHFAEREKGVGNRKSGAPCLTYKSPNQISSSTITEIIYVVSSTNKACVLDI